MVIALAILTGCCNENDKKETAPQQIISEQIANELISEMKKNVPANDYLRLEKGIKQSALLWNSDDGDVEEFKAFVKSSYIVEPKILEETFLQLSNNFESLLGCFNKISIDLKLKVHVDEGEIEEIDEIFAGYDVSAHFNDDMFKNKIAFIVMLNFPAYTLAEKTQYGENWTRLQWAYARMGDMFASRIPADVNKMISEVYANSDNYISNYNIFMGKLRNNDNQQLFPDNMKLITHWGLRDEIKSNYSYGESGLEKQEIIYQVMKRIIDQSIPETVINSEKYEWNPFNNTLRENGKDVSFHPEPHTRYQTLLNGYHAVRLADPYSPQAPTFIDRNFDSNMEIPVDDVEKLFIDFISDPLMGEVAGEISNRLQRPLKPWDIWYDGFKSRSSIDENELTKITQRKYPAIEAFQTDLPNILVKLGWSHDSAVNICSKIKVDASRGAGHAWGAEMRGDKARLRTRFGNDGMDYKGYNIAVHEFGHNVEQTISLYDIDYYLLHGVPNTSFTEALAFIFQGKDLELLGIKSGNADQKHLEALDNLWSCYEIMGVSLVDINVWKWLYANPDATAEQLQNEVIRIAKEVWNKYYAPVFGMENEPILAIYSHMIDYPLYLSAYPIGHLIDFQIGSFIERKNMADEVYRMFTQGTIIPQLWMKHAVSSEISIHPTLNAARKGLQAIKQ
jgi:hypothetical protein